MKKYTLKTVTDYIKGNDIEGFTTDELENSKEFMLLALRNSHDKNLYNLCSNKVKKGYEIVKYLINEYKNDVDFISKVADFYLANQKSELSKIDIALNMSELTKNRDPERYSRYNLIVASYYAIEKLKVVCTLNLFQDEELKEDLGTGFYLIYEKFNINPKVTNFFAEKYAISIMDSEKTDIERELHNKYKTPDKIYPNLWGYLVEYLSKYDQYLGEYIQVEATDEVKNKLNKKMRKIVENWDNYSDINEKQTVAGIMQLVFQFTDLNEDLNYFTYSDLCYFISKELDLLPYFLQTGIITEEDIECVKNAYKTDEEYYNNFKKDTKALFKYNRLKNNIKKVYEFNNKSREDFYTFDISEAKERIISIQNIINNKNKIK